MPWSNDEAIVKVAQKGDPLAWSILVRRYQVPLVALLVSRLGDPERAQAIASRAFEQGKSEISGLKEPAAFVEWLTELAFRIGKSNPPKSAADIQSPALEASAMDDLEHVRKLPESLRDPLLLHLGAGLTYEAVSGFLDLPFETVRNRIGQAREKLLKMERRRSEP